MGEAAGKRMGVACTDNMIPQFGSDLKRDLLFRTTSFLTTLTAGLLHHRAILIWGLIWTMIVPRRRVTYPSEGHEWRE